MACISPATRPAACDKLAGFFEQRQADLLGHNHLASHLEFLDLLVEGQEIHQVKHHIFDDHPKTTGSDFAFKREGGNSVKCIFTETQTHVFVFEEALVLLDD